MQISETKPPEEDRKDPVRDCVVKGLSDAVVEVRSAFWSIPTAGNEATLRQRVEAEELGSLLRVVLQLEMVGIGAGVLRQGLRKMQQRSLG